MNETERIYNSVEGSIGFICLLCGGNQILPHDNHKVTFPVCDECKKDLGEIIMEKREMAETSKPYFLICFSRDATIQFKRGSKTPDTTKLTYNLYVSIGNWEKDFVIWRSIK